MSRFFLLTTSLKKLISLSRLIKIFKIQRILLTPRYRRSQTNLLGRSLIFSDSASLVQSYKEIFDQNLYCFQSEKDNPLIIDCGSNIGLSIIYFKSIYPKARVIGFEPDSELFELLQQNMKNFGISDVEIYQCAIWEKEGEFTFEREGGLSGKLVTSSTKAGLTTVQTKSLNSLLSREEVDFLKIDIEGAEYRVLLSSKAMLKNVKNIFVEYHSFTGSPQRLDELLRILKDSGFRYYLYPVYEKKKPFHGLSDKKEMDLQINIYGIR